MSDNPVDQQKVIGQEEVSPRSAFERQENEAAAQLKQDLGKDGQLFMEVRVHSPFKEYYNGRAYSVSAENLTGPFDILPRHHNFITLLSPCDLIIRSDKGDERVQIAGGVMHVKADQVVVFLDV